MKMQVSSIMRRGTGRYYHWCPACETEHPLPDSWEFNGDVSKPTFSPSFAQTFTPQKVIDEYFDKGGSPRSKQVLCHYFVKDGNLQFLPDSWHGRSDIVAMPALPEPKGFAHETQD